MVDPPQQNVGELLPQSGTARLLVEIVRSGPDLVEAIGRIPAGHPLAADGVAPSFLGLELAAQAAAAWEALTRGERGEDCSARIGYLVRIREADLLRADLPVEAPLHVSVRLEGEAPPLAIYRVVVALRGEERVHGVLATHAGPGRSAEEAAVESS